MKRHLVNIQLIYTSARFTVVREISQCDYHSSLLSISLVQSHLDLIDLTLETKWVESGDKEM